MRQPKLRAFTASLISALLIGVWCARSEGGHGRDDDVDVVTAEQVKFFLDNGEKLVLVDLRPAQEFKLKRLPGARSIPLAELKQRFNEVPRAGRIILYCDCRPADESEAFFFLRDSGYRNVTVLQQGFSRWVSLKYPLEAGAK
jgi:sulfur-carrier protein adenylyltransferase/sulfurtransferase